MIIYKAENIINGKAYIGQSTKTLRTRMYGHKSAAKRKNKFKSKFYRAIRKYGFGNFEFSVIERVSSKKEMDEKETHYIKKYNSIEEGYNCTLGGEGFEKEYHPMYGKKRKYDLHGGDISYLCNGKRQTVKGWSLVGTFNNKTLN